MAEYPLRRAALGTIYISPLEDRATRTLARLIRRSCPRGYGMHTHTRAFAQGGKQIELKPPRRIVGVAAIPKDLFILVYV